MAIGKQLNNKSFYANSQGASGAPDIAMPPLDHTPAIATAAPDPWQAQQMQQQESNPFGAVPEELPQEVQQEMQQMQQQEEPEAQEQEQPVQQEHRKPSPNESFKAVKDAKERAERERDAMLAQMLEMQQRIQSMQQPKQQEEPVEDYDIDIESDALAEGKHLKKLVAKQKAMEKQLKAYQAMSEETAVEARIRSQYPDFEKVVSKENVDMLVAQYPDIANTLRNTPDMYNKAASTYTIIKNFGIHKDTPKYEADRAKAVSNAQKPRPLASVNPTQGDSPLSKANAFANGMTEDLKKQLREEMYAARKAM